MHSLASLSRAISVVENNLPHKSRIFNRLKSSKNKKAFVVGITGSAGSGKSTLIARLAQFMRQDKKRVAIVAVDPSSPETGGAFLGDRVRMQNLTEDPCVFIRSMASRGAKGGVAKSTKDVAFLLSHSGYDFVLIETVGAGQLDYEVTKFSDCTVLVVTPEAGDEMQFMKAGLRELADVFVINKSDRSGAKRMEETLRRSNEKKAPIFKTVAEQGKGIKELYEHVTTLSLRAKRSNP